jgi:hypothetical protein
MMNIIYILVSQPPPLYLLSPFGHWIQNSIIHIWIIYLTLYFSHKNAKNIHYQFNVRNDYPNQIRRSNKSDISGKKNSLCNFKYEI